MFTPVNPTRMQVNDLAKKHSAVWALRGASFDTSPGEILGLIGPNGSGKTTLFECVAGMRAPTRGTVSINGVVTSAEDRKQSLFLVPDGIHPWPDQTVDDVLRFVARMYGRSTDAHLATLDQLALAHLRRARLRELSKGEHRRVMLAIGLLTPQPILLLDEPFDGLDLRQTRDVIALLRQHAAMGRTLFLSVHQLADAERVCDRFLLLSGGSIVGRGTMDELRATAAAKASTGANTATLEDIFLSLT
ncbi:MAG: ABC transporter ATP-binding protein [Gemmatimonadaceae bacterium]